jgi:hypothetical protein
MNAARRLLAMKNAPLVEPDKKRLPAYPHSVRHPEPSSVSYGSPILLSAESISHRLNTHITYMGRLRIVKPAHTAKAQHVGPHSALDLICIFSPASSSNSPRQSQDIHRFRSRPHQDSCTLIDCCTCRENVIHQKDRLTPDCLRMPNGKRTFDVLSTLSAGKLRLRFCPPAA